MHYTLYSILQILNQTASFSSQTSPAFQLISPAPVLPLQVDAENNLHNLNHPNYFLQDYLDMKIVICLNMETFIAVNEIFEINWLTLF